MLLTTIRVSAAHLRDGSPVESKDCPIALGVNDAIHRRLFAAVGATKVHIFHAKSTKHLASFDLPARALTARRQIDYLPDWLRRLIVRPFEFELDIPRELLRGGYVPREASRLKREKETDAC